MGIEKEKNVAEPQGKGGKVCFQSECGPSRKKRDEEVVGGEGGKPNKNSQGVIPKG